MLYAILCYDDEKAIGSWSKEQDDEAMTKLSAVQAELATQRRLGPVARLQPSKAAVTVRKGKDMLVMDGPFAETKEQLLGFFVIDCVSLDEAVATAKDLAVANHYALGCYEIRPLTFFTPGGPLR